MAPIWGPDRYDLHHAFELHPAGRCARADRREPLHACRAARDRVLGGHLRVPRNQPEAAPRRGDVLRQVGSERAVLRFGCCDLDECGVEAVGALTEDSDTNHSFRIFGLIYYYHAVVLSSHLAPCFLPS